MSLDLFEVSFLFVGLQALLFAIILFTTGRGQLNNSFFLGFFLLVLAIQAGVVLYFRVLDSEELPYPYLCVFGFLYGPSLWFYCKSLVYRDYSFGIKDFIHFIPAAIMLIGALLGFNLCGTFGSLFYVLLITYTSLIVRDLLRYRKVIDQTQSTNEDIKLKWLQWIAIMFTLTFLLDIYEHFVGNLEVIEGLSVVNVSLIVLINGIYFRGLRHPDLFRGISIEDKVVTQKTVNREREDWSQEMLELTSFMEENQPFLDPKLSLNQLAELMSFQPRKLSELINDYAGKNFMDFINTYRIEAAKERFLNPKDAKETVLEVMYDVGFNSKSSFNTIFKKKVGQTPSEYKKSLSSR